MKFIDCAPNEVKKVTERKLVYLYGAGRALDKVIDFCLINNINIELIIDKRADNYFYGYEYNGKKYDVITVSELLEKIENHEKEIVIFITSVIYNSQIIEELNAIETLDDVEFISFKELSNKRTVCEFDFTLGKRKIPQIIHYCWFGNGKLQKQMELCLDSWKKFASDYEIICWNENNYDVSKTPYIEEAYKNEQWAFVSDYARLDIIEQFGGVYLDVDVELIKNIDVLLCDEAFFGMHGNFIIATGVGCGAVAHHKIFKDMMEVYNNIHFLNKDGSFNRTANNVYNMPIFKRYGFINRNEYQNKNGVVVYPSEVLSPLGPSGEANFFSDKTLSIHHGTKTWLTTNEFNEYRK